MVSGFSAGYNAVMAIVLSSPAFRNNQAIPRKYTGDGDDVSPPLAWSGIPAEAEELALIVDDPDAPTPEPWVHWLIYKIPPSVTSLTERIAPALRADKPRGSLQGKNSWPKGIGYRGPAPPKGHGVHHYHFQLLALDCALDIEPGAEKAALLAAVEGHVIASAELVGTYQR